MKKFALSLATTAVMLSGCGGENGESGKNGNENEQNQEVTEEPDANLAEEDSKNNDQGTEGDLNETNDNGDSLEEGPNEETEAVLDQNIENFKLNVTLVDDTQWDFTYQPSEEEGDPSASVSGDDIELEGQEAVDEMETYLSNFHVNAASEQQEITSEIADTFDFNQEDIQDYSLTIDFPEQENETEWTWSQDEEERGGSSSQENDENPLGSNNNE